MAQNSNPLDGWSRGSDSGLDNHTGRSNGVRANNEVANGQTKNEVRAPLYDRSTRLRAVAGADFRLAKPLGLAAGHGKVDGAGEVVPRVASATCGEPVNPLSAIRPTRGKPTVEFGKSSKFTWQFRLRWNSEPGRPVVYVATVADSTFEMIRSGNYEDYKRQLIADYKARIKASTVPASNQA